jgi:hypothetical protein
VLSLAVVGTSSAAPSNENTDVITADCDGATVVFTALLQGGERSNPAFHVVDGDEIFKVASLTAFDPETGEVIFTFEAHVAPTKPLVTCTGTATEVDPGTGQELTFDFEVTGVFNR